jgi:YidC/Oxa1 family membrane protein insertase
MGRLWIRSGARARRRAGRQVLQPEACDLMDRQGWIAVILCIAGLVLWQWYYVKHYDKGQPPVPAEAAPATTTPAPAAASAAEPAQTAQPVPGPAPSAPAFAPRNESIVTENAEYVFSNDAGGIERAVLLLHLGEEEQAVVLNGNRSLPIGALGFAPAEVTGGFEMRIDRARGTATFTKTEPDGLRITKRFTVPDEKAGNPYLLTLEIGFENPTAQPLARAAYFVSTGGGAPIHARDLPMYTKFFYMHGGKKTGIDVNWFNPGGIAMLGLQWSGPKSLYQEMRPDIEWAAVKSQYFATILTAEEPRGVSVWAARFDTKKQNESPVYGIQGAMGMPPLNLAPGASATASFSVYAGPKDLPLLRAMRSGQEAVLDFGMFGFISKLLLWGMNSLHGIFGNYALAIIVLTLIIKSLLWPVQNKATREMRKMAALSPKMTEMREKFKDDPQKLNEEMMKMYREYGVNPFSGCLPMLIQIPIFFGFYAMLGSAIELRNSSFLWVGDLSQPDTVGHFLGFPINLLPLVMAATMVWQMVITPKTGDKMQQRIFYFMPVIFLVFCYNFASALALYWTTQNIFSIVQLYLTRNNPLPELEKKSVVAKREATAAKKKKKRRKP